MVLGFAIFVVAKRWQDAKEKLPYDDEMWKKILRREFEERIDLERSTLIGAGMLGTAVIYALSWLMK